MRALRVLGLAEDGENLLCEDTVTGEVFSLRSDERLRAAVRGELRGTGQRSVETDPQLRPREIQALTFADGRSVVWRSATSPET